MAIVGVANLAVKVSDLDAAVEFYEAAGATVSDRMFWRNGERADVRLGALDLTLFTQAIYEERADLPADGFLHVALFTDDLDREIEGHDVVWGPDVVSGVFGTRRIVFVAAPGEMRLEFMQQVEPPPGGSEARGGDARARRLTALGSATLGESGGRPLDRRIAAAWDGAMLAGPCFPVRCAPGDNLAVHAAVAEAPAGSVLAVQVDDDRARGFWGEVLTVAAQRRGCAGVVIDACVRDTDQLRTRSFPVFSTGVALPGAAKAGPGDFGTVADIGGVSIRTGDWLVADRDGVVAIEADALDEVEQRALARAEHEVSLFAALDAGATTVDLLGLDVTSITGPDTKR